MHRLKQRRKQSKNLQTSSAEFVLVSLLKVTRYMYKKQNTNWKRLQELYEVVQVRGNTKKMRIWSFNNSNWLMAERKVN